MSKSTTIAKSGEGDMHDLYSLTKLKAMGHADGDGDGVEQLTGRLTM